MARKLNNLDLSRAVLNLSLNTPSNQPESSGKDVFSLPLDQYLEEVTLSDIPEAFFRSCDDAEPIPGLGCDDFKEPASELERGMQDLYELDSPTSPRKYRH